MGENLEQRIAYLETLIENLLENIGGGMCNVDKDFTLTIRINTDSESDVYETPLKDYMKDLEEVLSYYKNHIESEEACGATMLNGKNISIHQFWEIVNKLNGKEEE